MEKELKREVISLSIVLVIAYTLFILCDVFFKLVTWGGYSADTNSYKLTMLFGVIVYSFILAFTKKTSKATIISYVMIFLLGIINQVKVSFTSEPIVFSDINFFSKIGDLMDLVTGNVSTKYVVKFVLFSVGYAAILALIAWLNKKYDMELKNKKARIAIVIIDILILLVLFNPTNTTKDWFLKVFFDTDSYVDFDSYTTNLTFYSRHGIINGMYGVSLNNKFLEPKDYDEAYLNGLVEKVSAEDSSVAKVDKPNIIVVFSESFWDVSKIEDTVKYNKPITENFNKLKNKGELIEVISPAYGGMSENVSFEILTGGSMNYFSKGYIPIMSLYNRKGTENSPSLVRDLKNNGYTTEIVFGKDYYNSEKTYKKIGFENYRQLHGEEGFVGLDEYATDKLIERLEQKGENPMFYVMASIESHMPYPEDKYDEELRTVKITESKLSKEENVVMTTYAQGMYHADLQLARLYEYIQGLDEPTMILLFGDHLPFLHTKDNTNVIFELDYFNTDDDLKDDYNLYNIQALLLSNFENEIEMPDYLGTDQLLLHLLKQFNVELNPYYDWLYSTSNILAGSNRIVSIDKQGNVYRTSELDGQMLDVYNTKKLMQYKYFINNK